MRATWVPKVFFSSRRDAIAIAHARRTRSRHASPTSTPCSAKGRSGSRARRALYWVDIKGRKIFRLDRARQARAVANAVPGRLARAARERRVHRRHRPRASHRSTSTPGGSRSFPNPEARPARQSLQRRQGRPPGPLLGGDHGRYRAQAAPARSTGSSPTSRSTRGRRWLQGHQRPRVQPVGRPHVPQ